jgi:hypothetical protein
MKEYSGLNTQKREVDQDHSQGTGWKIGEVGKRLERGRPKEQR